MGRTKGTKNRVGHKAGGARKGAGRKPRVSEDFPKEPNGTGAQRSDITSNASPEQYPLRPVFDDFTATVFSSVTSDVGVQQLLTPMSLSSQPLPFHESLDVRNIASFQRMDKSLIQPRVTPVQGHRITLSGLSLDARHNDSFALCQSSSNLARPYLTPNDSSLTPLPSYESVTPPNAMSPAHLYQSSHVSNNYTSPPLPSNIMMLPSPTAVPSTPLSKHWTTQSTSSELSNALGFSISSTTPGATTSPNSVTHLSPLAAPNPLPTLHLPSPSPSVSSSPPDYSPVIHKQRQVSIATFPQSESTPDERVWEFPYPLPAAVGDPDQRPFAITMGHKRRRRRCLVCVHVGMEQNSYECPGRGSRSKCPSFRPNESLASPKRYPAARISFAHDSNPSSFAATMQVDPLRVSESNQILSSPNYGTLENVQKRAKHCMVCVSNGREGIACPGRGNRSLCPDHVPPA